MKNYEQFLEQKETAQSFNRRLQIFVNEYVKYHKNHNESLNILDIGCGKNAVLFRYKIMGDCYYGCDFWDAINVKLDGYKKIDLNKENLSEKFENIKFDVIFCGEVIEHLFSPDNLIDEIKKLMHSESLLILSTPNLGCWINRFLLIFGISPLYLENSSEFKLGRKFKRFGQWNKTEGHIKLFTYGALKDFVKFKQFTIVKVISTFTWDFYVDRLICLLSKSLSQCNIFLLKNN